MGQALSLGQVGPVHLGKGSSELGQESGLIGNVPNIIVEAKNWRRLECSLIEGLLRTQPL